MRIASSHACLGTFSMNEIFERWKSPITFDTYPLSHPLTRGPASMIPSRASASAMIDARGPSPIGLRLTTSTPMARAARMAVTQMSIWTPSRVALSSPLGRGSSADCRSYLSVSSFMKTTRPAGASPLAGPSGVGLLSGSKGAARVIIVDPGASKEDQPPFEGAEAECPTARRSQLSGVGGRSSSSCPVTPSRSS